MHGVIEQARKVDWRPMREVSALGQIKSEHGIARFEKRQVHGGVGLRPRMRLYVGVLGAEQLPRAVDRDLLHDVDDFAATVVAFARQSFRILVVQRRTHGLEHGGRHKVFTRDEFQPVVLPRRLTGDELGNLRIGCAERSAGWAAGPLAPGGHGASGSSIFSTRRS